MRHPLLPTLALLVMLLSASPAGAASSVGQAAPASPRPAAMAADHLARLREVIEASGLKVKTADQKAWVVAYAGDHLETVVVYISLFEHFVLVQSEVAPTKPTIDQAIQILKMNYVLDLARIGIDDEGNVTALQEADVTTLDAATLRRMVQDVARAADDCAAVFKAGLVPARLEIPR